MFTWSSHPAELAGTGNWVLSEDSPCGGHWSLFVAAEHPSLLLQSEEPSRVQGGAGLPRLHGDARGEPPRRLQVPTRSLWQEGQGSHSILSASSRGHLQAAAGVALTSVSHVPHCWPKCIQCKRRVCSALGWLWDQHYSSNVGIVLTAKPPGLVLESFW